MEKTLSDVSIRILGCLVEKERTTPESYPLTLNALRNACNQKSNRRPVVAFDEAAVLRGLEQLRDQGYVARVRRADSRATKYEHRMLERLDLSEKEAALLAELMLRGPQTPGELRTRAGRMCDFGDLEAVETTLNALIARPDPLVLKLPRRPGQKECRYAHRLGGTPALPDEEQPPPPVGAEAAQTGKGTPQERRLAELEETVRALREELRALREEFEGFRGQFEP